MARKKVVSRIAQHSSGFAIHEHLTITAEQQRALGDRSIRQSWIVVQSGIEHEQIHVATQVTLQCRYKPPVLQQAQRTREVDGDVHVAPRLGIPANKGAEEEGEFDEIITGQQIGDLPEIRGRLSVRHGFSLPPTLSTTVRFSCWATV